MLYITDSIRSSIFQHLKLDKHKCIVLIGSVITIVPPQPRWVVAVSNFHGIKIYSWRGSWFLRSHLQNLPISGSFNRHKVLIIIQQVIMCWTLHRFHLLCKCNSNPCNVIFVYFVYNLIQKWFVAEKKTIIKMYFKVWMWVTKMKMGHFLWLSLF